MQSMVENKAAVLAPVRFGEFLRDRAVISEEQWIAALAAHWSHAGLRIGEAVVAAGFAPAETIEAEARAFHDELDVVEVDVAAPVPPAPRHLRTTVPLRAARAN